MSRPKLVQSLDSMYTRTEMVLIFVLGDAFIDYSGRPTDADGPKIKLHKNRVFDTEFPLYFKEAHYF